MARSGDPQLWFGSGCVKGGVGGGVKHHPHAAALISLTADEAAGPEGNRGGGGRGTKGDEGWRETAQLESEQAGVRGGLSLSLSLSLSVSLSP